MYSQGMAPVYRILPGRSHWERIRDKPKWTDEEDVFTISFKYRTPENSQCVVYFAFTYPYPLSDIQKLLINIDVKYLNATALSEDDIYYSREQLCISLGGRAIDLLTITSYHGITSEREARLTNLFPFKSTPRPFKFLNKKIIFLSARVHPGETPSSFVFSGILNLLLTREDPIAIMLRKLYVFKLIPCLNPDGVYLGHYRTDTKGVNLNRMYLSPKFSEHPAIYAARSLIKYYHFGREVEDVIENSQSNINISTKVSNMTLQEAKNLNSQAESKILDNKLDAEGNIIKNDNNDNSVDSGLFLYVDMHGHASKKGIFMYGNHFDDVEQNVECIMLPKIMSINNQNFHFSACNFTEKNMYHKDKRDGMSREGSGRVAVLKLTGLVKSYTLECNYNTGKLVNNIPSTVRDHILKTPNFSVPPKYTPQIFEEVGKSLGYSILDLTGQNPFSRIPYSEFHTISGLMNWLRYNGLNEIGINPDHKRTSAGPRAQDKSRRCKITKLRPASLKKSGKLRPKTVFVERKENVLLRARDSKPSCSRVVPEIKHDLKSRAATLNKSIGVKANIKKDLSLKPKNNANLKKQKSKLKTDVASVANQKDKTDIASQSETGGQVLSELGLIKPNARKVVEKKFKSSPNSNNKNNNSVIVTWDNKSTRFLSKSKILSMPSSPSKTIQRAGSSSEKVTILSLDHYTKNSKYSKTKLKKLSLRRLTSAGDCSGKFIDKIKKRKKLKSK